jgi:hypothetical protein
MVVDLIIGTTLIALAFDGYLQRQRLQRAESAGCPCPGCGRNLGYPDQAGGRPALCTLCRHGRSYARISPSIN